MSATVALALSPHLDDAVFSCGGMLARLASNGWRVVVATLFTESVPDPTGFALACQTDKGLGPDVDYMALRRQEDAAALAALGAEPVWMPFREAPHRGYGSAAALFAAPLPADDAIVTDLAQAIAGLCAMLAPRLLLAPQAIGGHVDHVRTIEAIDRAAPAIPVLRWRDFPYDLREAVPPEPFGSRFAGLPARDVALTPTERDAKRAACLAYGSQLGFQFGGAAGLDAMLDRAGPVERFRGEAIP